jgi:hypothetical protein
MKKIILIGSGVVIAAVIALVVLVVLNLGGLIKTAVEKYGPPITKTEVRLGSADISVLSGSGSLDDFFLGNPKGFSMPSAVECDTIRVSVVTDSLTTDTIVIDEIYVDGPVISYEKKGSTDNFKTIVNNIKQTVAGEKKADKPAGEDSATETGSEKKIVINNFIVKNGKINVGGSLLKVFGDKGMGIDMPDIHMKDIGKDKETSPAEAFSQILAEMTGGVSGSVTQFGKELQKQLGKAVEGAGKAVEDVTKGGAESVGGAIKGLFGSE